MSDAEVRNLQERIAHLERALEDTSAEVARHQKQIALLEARVKLLLGRAAEAEFDEGGSVPLADWKPPHW